MYPLLISCTPRHEQGIKHKAAAQQKGAHCSSAAHTSDLLLQLAAVATCAFHQLHCCYAAVSHLREAIHHLIRGLLVMLQVQKKPTST
jgi:hypothetical protein